MQINMTKNTLKIMTILFPDGKTGAIKNVGIDLTSIATEDIIYPPNEYHWRYCLAKTLVKR
jgi:hypothetical protein